DARFRDSKLYRRNDSRLNRVGRWFHNHLRTIQLLHQVQFVAKMRITDWRNRRKVAQTQAGSPATQEPIMRNSDNIGIENMIYFEPVDEEWKEGWHVTEGLITEM